VNNNSSSVPVPNKRTVQTSRQTIIRKK
jgi:hypothetical protein